MPAPGLSTIGSERGCVVAYVGYNGPPSGRPIRAEGCRGGIGAVWLFTRLSREGDYTIAPANGGCWARQGEPAAEAAAPIERSQTCEGAVAFRLMPVR